MPNRLIHESSPYLLQHAHNPVDWFPWGDEALAKARAEDRPILLSIGYSACHWCHVMEHESFENPAIAAMMNEHFVNVKVDREERPDLDSIYMTAVQAMTGHGGWPMTMFLTPEGIPFYGGTYFPPEDRGRMPGFPRVLASVADAYRGRRDEVSKNAESVRELLQRRIAPRQDGPLEPALLDQATAGMLAEVDWTEGGWGRAPKFPQPMSVELLLRTYVRNRSPKAIAAVDLTLTKMAHGGIYDQLGGGFHRYSVDGEWLVPHFEKMLYDNAQLARAYLQAYLVTGNGLYRRIADETLGYVLREMTDAAGGFYSTQDADSEGVEGKFFVWTVDEVDALLGDADGPLVRAYFDITPHGNFEHRNILRVLEPIDAVARRLGVEPARLADVVATGRRRLFEAREQRIKPGRDEKVLGAWNGMMLRTFAEAGASLGEPIYLQAAVRNAEFLRAHLWQGGRLLRTWKDGRAKLNGYLEDYAHVADGLVALYEATFDLRWLTFARELADVMLDRFADPEAGGFFDTASDHEQLVTRPKDLYDNATPAGSSVAADVLQRLALLTGDDRYRRAADGALTVLGTAPAQYPTAFARLLCAADFSLARPHEIAIIGSPDADDTRALRQVVFGQFRPHRVVAGSDGLAPDGDASIPLLRDRPRRDGRATAYVCEGYVCRAPVTEPSDLAAQLTEAAR